MKAFHALIVLGVIPIIIGIYAAIPPPPGSGTYRATIPTGNYYWIEFNVWKTGRISGTFSEASGNPVLFYVFDAAEYTYFNLTGQVESLYETYGATGSFSAATSWPGDYYIVLRHGTSALQSVQVSYLLDGINPVFLGSGLALVLFGLVLAYVGYRKKRKTMASQSITDAARLTRTSFGELRLFQIDISENN